MLERRRRGKLLGAVAFAWPFGKEPIAGVTPEAMTLLERHRWPGNVRELRNAIERAMILEESSRITAASLPIAIGGFWIASFLRTLKHRPALTAAEEQALAPLPEKASEEEAQLIPK